MARPLDLAEQWADLLRRRPAFRESLALYGDILAGWAAWPARRVDPLAWSEAQCRQRWERGVPLLAETAPALRAADLEDLLGPVMERLAELDPARAPALQRFAEAWDLGRIGPAALFPARGRIGSGAAEEASGLDADAVAFLACAGLRPALERFFARCHAHATERAWSLGLCPFCGAPPGFTDVVEDGRRRLACHLCGAGWHFAKLRCPLCGVEGAADLVRLQPEASEEGYLVAACRQCRGYVKELDRRARWNGQSALIEDWGSPHFDLVAQRQGYWRPLPSLVQLVSTAP